MNRISVLLICTMVLAYTLSTAQHGGLDMSFDNDGIVTTTIGTEGNYCSNIAVQNDGKILLVGTSDIGTNNNPLDVLTLVRFATEGTLDISFDGDDITHFDLGGAVRGKPVAILPDGKILTAGTNGGAATQDFLIAIFNNKRTINIKKIV